MLLAGLGYAVGGLLIKHRFSDVQPLGLVSAVMFWSAVLLLPAAVIGAPSEVPDIGPIAAVAVLGVVGTGISFVIFYWLIGARRAREDDARLLHRARVRGRLRRRRSSTRTSPSGRSSGWR